MEDTPDPPTLIHDINFEIVDSGYEIWFSDRVSNDHPDLVDKCADWLEDQVGVVNLGQIDHSALMTDGVLTGLTWGVWCLVALVSVKYI